MVGRLPLKEDILGSNPSSATKYLALVTCLLVGGNDIFEYARKEKGAMDIVFSHYCFIFFSKFER